MEVTLEVKALSKKYAKVQGAKNVSFEVEKGEVFALIGPNGAGKTTTIRMIATLLTPTDGDAIVDGYSIVREPAKVRELITYLPDEDVYKRQACEHSGSAQWYYRPDCRENSCCQGWKNKTV